MALSLRAVEDAVRPRKDFVPRSQEDFKQAIRRLKEENRKSEETIQHLKEENRKSEQTIQHLKENLKTNATHQHTIQLLKEENLKIVSKTIRKLTDENLKANSAHERLKEEKQEAIQRLTEENLRANSAHEQAIQRLKEEKREAIQRLKEEKREAIQRLTEENLRANSAHEQAVQRLKEEKREAIQRLANEQKTTQKVKDENASYQLTMGHLKEEHRLTIQQLLDQIANSSETNKKLEGTLQASQEEVNQARSMCQSLQDERGRLLEELKNTKEQLAIYTCVKKTLANSAYKRYYMMEKIPNQLYIFLGAIHQLIKDYCSLKGFLPNTADKLFEELQKEAFSNPDELLYDVAGACQRLWTSAKKIPDDIEFCSILNFFLQTDAEASMKNTAICCRALNSLCITRGIANTVPWPPTNILYRGGGLPKEHHSFFAVGTRYRVPMYLATSKDQGISYRFCKRAQKEKSQPPVMWLFHLHPVLGARSHQLFEQDECSW